MPSWKQKVRAARAAEETDPYTRAKTIVYNQLAYSAKPEVSCVRSCRQKASRRSSVSRCSISLRRHNSLTTPNTPKCLWHRRAAPRSSPAALRRELAERGVRGEEAENALAQRTDEQET